MQDWFGRVTTGEGYVPRIWFDKSKQEEAMIQRIVVTLNGSVESEQVLPIARTFARTQGAEVTLLTVNDGGKLDEPRVIDYLRAVSTCLKQDGLTADHALCSGNPATEIDRYAVAHKIDVIAMTTGVTSSVKSMLASGSIVGEVIRKTLVPVLVVRHDEHWRNRYSSFKNVLVALDGSETAESVLPYIRTIAQANGSRVTLLFVAEGGEADAHRHEVEAYLTSVVDVLRREKIDATSLFTGTDPAHTILSVCDENGYDLLMMASHGRGGIARPHVHLGNVTEKVVKEANCPVFVVPLTRSST
jgi:nucleotide-binding universal stress UspA family protein